MIFFAETIWTSIGTPILEGILPIIASIVGVALVALAKRGLDYLGLKKDAQADALLDKWIPVGIGYAEQWAVNKLKTETKVSSEDKLALATKTVMAELTRSGIKKVAEEAIVARIEAAIAGGATKKEVST